MLAHPCQGRVEHLLKSAVAVHQQQSIFPRTYPDAPVAGLEHPQATTVAVIANADRFKLVVQTIQSFDSRTAPIGDGPYLVGIVNQNLCSSIVGRQLILSGLACLDAIVPYPILHR